VVGKKRDRSTAAKERQRMDSATPQQLVEQYWQLMNTNDWRAVGKRRVVNPPLPGA
jgi:hypothetical protein